MEERLKHYVDLLKKHDWSYQMSDDYSAYERGRANMLWITVLQTELDPDYKIYNEHAPEGYKVKEKVDDTDRGYRA